MSVPTHISIVIPAYNEAATLKSLYHQIRDVMESIGASHKIFLVDDGSSEGSFRIMTEVYRFLQNCVLGSADSTIPSSENPEEIPTSHIQHTSQTEV